MTLFARVRSWVRASMHVTDFERTMRDEIQVHLALYVVLFARASGDEASIPPSRPQLDPDAIRSTSIAPGS